MEEVKRKFFHNIMDTILEIVRLFIIGFKDCFVGIFCSVNLRQRKGFSELFKKLIYCVGLNGIAIGIVSMFFEKGLLPLVHLVLSCVGAVVLWEWLYPFLAYTFNVLWILPLLAITRVVNCVLYQDIADKTFEMYHGHRKAKTSCRSLADLLASTMLQFLFLGQSFAVSLIPIPLLSDFLTIVHLCLLYSLYSFEYKWINMDRPLHQRLDAIDYNWPYFIGFGFPLAISTIVINHSIFRIVFFSLIFPLYVMSSTICTPTVGEFSFRPHIFSPVNTILNFIMGKLFTSINRTLQMGQS